MSSQRSTPSRSFSSGRHPQVFVVDSDSSSPDHYFEGIRRRIRKKQLQGKRLSAVESYFNRRGFKAGANLFGPSKFSVVLEIAKAWTRPLPVVILLTILLLTESSSLAHFSLDRSRLGEELLDDLVATAAYSEEEFASENISLEDLAEREKFDFSRKYTTPAQYHGLVQFISGVIAVYRPSEKNAGELARFIVETSHRKEIDPLYVASVIAVESSFHPQARSKVGAKGLMQVMPATAKEIVKRHNGGEGRRHLSDPQTNIDLGISYLKYLEQHFGSRNLALQAYNWGPTNVTKSRKGLKRTPRSVIGYSRKILERTLRWNKHFERASQSAQTLRKNLNVDS